MKVDWEFMQRVFDFSSDIGWMTHVFTIILITAFIHLIEVRLYNRLYSRLQKTANRWDSAFIWSVHKPLGILIWMLGLSYAVRFVVGLDTTWVEPVFRTAIVLMVAWSLIRFVNTIEHSYTREGIDSSHDITTAIAISKVLRIVIFVTSALVILPNFGIPTTKIWALGGASSIVVGFAAKDLLANFFGAMMIYFDRPFSVGDWVRSPDKNIEGVVEYIGWRTTRIRTFDKRPLYVPNSVFSTIAVENPSRMQNRRIREIIGIRYQDGAKMDLITNDIYEMLQNHPEIDTNRLCLVNFVAFGPSSLDIMVYTFTKTTAWAAFQKIKQDVLIKIMNIILAHESEIAFPTTTVEVPQGIAMMDAKVNS